MSINNQTKEQFDYLFAKLSKRFPPDEENKVMTDICFQAKSDTGELNILNDDDELIATAVIPDWINYTEEDFVDVVAKTLKEYIISQKSALEELSILHPFTLLLVDDDKESIRDIYELDDDSIVIDHEDLMKGLDKDLTDFIEKLLKE